MIRILADENIPSASVESLQSTGFDIATVSHRSAADVAVDRDFGELIYRRGQPAPCGIVFLRFVPITPEEPAAVLQGLLEHGTIELEGRFTIVTREQVRQRPLQ